MKRLYFMRHGLSVYNQIGKFSGRIDSPLTDEGRDDVRNTADSVKKLKIDTIVSSPLSRALESAQIIAEIIEYPENKILISDLFSERDFGILEGTPYTPLAVNDNVEEIESVEDLIKRAQKAYEWLNTLESDDILIVSHGSLGRALHYVVSQEEPYIPPAKFENAKIVKLI